MSEQFDLNQNLELIDAMGHTVGIVLPPKTAQELTAERDRLREEVRQLQNQLAEVQSQLNSWKEKARISEERATQWEQDWRDIYKLLPAELRVTEEDIAEIQRDPHTFDEILQMLEQYKPS